jgi:hypothetical protein
MIEIRGSVTVHLIGGPMDGDSFVLAPNGSLCVPQQLSYMAAAEEQAAWMVYESEHVFRVGWPESDETWRYSFVGMFSLGKGRVLKSSFSGLPMKIDSKAETCQNCAYFHEPKVGNLGWCSIRELPTARNHSCSEFYHEGSV